MVSVRWQGHNLTWQKPYLNLLMSTRRWSKNGTINKYLRNRWKYWEPGFWLLQPPSTKWDAYMLMVEKNKQTKKKKWRKEWSVFTITISPPNQLKANNQTWCISWQNYIIPPIKYSCHKNILNLSKTLASIINV